MCCFLFARDGGAGAWEARLAGRSCPAPDDHLLRTIDTNYVQMFDNLYFNFHYCRRSFIFHEQSSRELDLRTVDAASIFG